MIAGSDMANGSASSLTDNVSRSDNRASSARRVGSDNAVKVRSSTCSLYLTMWFSIDASHPVSSALPQSGKSRPSAGERQWTLAVGGWLRPATRYAVSIV